MERVKKKKVKYSCNIVVECQLIMLVPNGIKISKRVIKRVNFGCICFSSHLTKRKKNLLEKNL